MLLEYTTDKRRSHICTAHLGFIYMSEYAYLLDSYYHIKLLNVMSVYVCDT